MPIEPSALATPEAAGGAGILAALGWMWSRINGTEKKIDALRAEFRADDAKIRQTIDDNDKASQAHRERVLVELAAKPNREELREMLKDLRNH